ncbi:nitroreductase family deazaflavin-dependent oxidoreductase [Nocardioides sp.]|jgi:deazaflavin-dependent oxidoreductase (nitroreductase family)|uniref:nitroreductase family deazaflavin-dependent oxidoreductase n=1 Tax=Nocardioides sp. TaxID=35761 RepID=UPI002C793A99|nr:nitroreductase family deazaflavin-dependent oxidoreductase [Nocardioides sp.]HVX55948.1 nitroreductase family deazaflavin-dependent oxidoreductase [Nocardioides sp.]
MHLPRALAAFNRRVTNPIQRRWAGRIPGHAIIEHTGRRSRRIYRTPVLCVRRPRGFAFVVGYGLESDWVRNLLAADGGTVVHRGRRYRVADVRLVPAPAGRALLPNPLRLILRLAHEGDVLTVTIVD